MMKLTKSELQALAQFEYNIEGPTFRRLFIKFGGTKSMARHLWSKFDGYNHSILRLWGACDLENRRKLVKVINHWQNYPNDRYTEDWDKW